MWVMAVNGIRVGSAWLADGDGVEDPLSRADGKRDVDDNCSSDGADAVDADRAVMRAHQLSDNRQSDPAARNVGCIAAAPEPFEDVLPVRVGDSDAGITNVQSGEASDRRDLNGDAAAWRRELDRVAQQVDGHLT